LTAGRRPPVGLIVLDGWGLSDQCEGNAVALARTPAFDRLRSEHPHTSLVAHGRAVGVREGQIGNSEIGHLNLGAGRVVKQDILRIDDTIADGSFFEIEPSTPSPTAATCRPRRGWACSSGSSRGSTSAAWA
jgi:2,3-bisphosphoglycerate-independent phosphoglycerate mutase